MRQTTTLDEGNYGPYHPCNDGDGPDPLTWATVDAQIARVRSLLPTPNDIKISCYYEPKPDSYGEVDHVTDVGSGLESIALSNTAVGPYLATSSTAGTILHEVMHLHGYRHGYPLAATACGWRDDGDASWGRHHTVPNIMNACMTQVVSRSQTVCGNPEDHCPAGYGYMNLAHDFDGTVTSCDCVPDPSSGLPAQPIPNCSVDVVCGDGVWLDCSATNRPVTWSQATGSGYIDLGSYDAGDTSGPYLIHIGTASGDFQSYRVCNTAVYPPVCTGDLVAAMPHTPCEPPPPRHCATGYHDCGDGRCIPQRIFCW
jgi:hypothetical protein